MAKSVARCSTGTDSAGAEGPQLGRLSTGGFLTAGESDSGSC